MVSTKGGQKFLEGNCVYLTQTVVMATVGYCKLIEQTQWIDPLYTLETKDFCLMITVGLGIDFGGQSCGQYTSVGQFRQFGSLGPLQLRRRMNRCSAGRVKKELQFTCTLCVSDILPPFFFLGQF